jgi:hypothetical protein
VNIRNRTLVPVLAKGTECDSDRTTNSSNTDCNAITENTAGPVITELP